MNVDGIFPILSVCVYLLLFNLLVLESRCLDYCCHGVIFV